MPIKKVIGILLAGGMGTRLKGLTDHLAKPAVHFGGKYRIIDFTLSNCSNSGIDTVGIITQYEPIELTSYIGNGSAWDLDTLDGGITVLPPYTSKFHKSILQKGTAHAVFQHLNYIELYNPDYILILSGDHIYKMDYSLMIEKHLKLNAGLTIASIKVDIEEAKRFGIMQVDETMRIIDFEEKPIIPKSNIASMGVYLFNYDILKEMLYKFNNDHIDEFDFGKHLIPYAIKNYDTYAYMYYDYWRDIGTLESLWKANMELIDHPEYLNLRDNKWPIYSNANHFPAHHAFEKSLIRNSMVCDGTIIQGNVYHSVISSGVVVGVNSTIVNTVVMPYVKIGDNCFIKNAIIKMNVIIPCNTIIDNEEITLVTDEYFKKLKDVKI